MLSGLRDAQGRLTVRGRILAAIVAVGLLLLSAPVLVPVLRTLLEAVGNFMT